MEEKPDLPDDPRKPLPDHDRPCPECGAEHSISEMESERESVSRKNDRIDYWCPDCGTHIGVKFEYTGPTPVPTHNGWEMH
jgi:predicted RNA-binding Zn-ribbon protein involved in translation (DUF1610 family)